MIYYHKLPMRIVVIINHLMLFFGVCYLEFDVLSLSFILFGYFVSFLGEELALHRYFTHNSYKTSSLKHKFLLCLSVLAGLGPTIWFTGTHKLHHAYSDTEKDPHSPHHNTIANLWLGRWHKYGIPSRLVRKLIRDKTHVFIIRNYLYIWCCIWITGLLVSPYLCFFFGGVCLSYHVITAVNVFCHLDKTRNNILLLYLTLGAAHHNIHHRYPNRTSNNIKGEFDLCGIIIEKYLKITEK
jgi:stearoyl-CoA desaturase (delta-9 desaturase)